MPAAKPLNLSRPQRKAPRTRLEWDVPSFGSLDTTTDPVEMDELDSPDALNNVYDSVGATKTRAGYIKLLTTSLTNPIVGMRQLYQSNGTKQLVYASGTHWYIYNNAGDSTQLTGVPSSFTNNLQTSMDVFQDSIYGGNGTDALVAYNGTTISTVNSAITPQYVKIFKNRIYCANASSSRLYFSDAGNPSSFPTNNFIDINTNDGQFITGIEVLLDSLVVFKSDSIFVITGEPLGAGNLTTIGNLQLRQANSDVGCTAFRTIKKIGPVLFFMHKSGVYVFQNNSSQLLTQKLNYTFQNAMNTAFMNLCWALYSPTQKKYILGYPAPGSSVCNMALVYDFITKGWSMWDNIPGSCAVSYQFGTVAETILMGDPNKGNIYELFNGTADISGDNGTSSGSNSSTSLNDTTKSWTTSQFVDARVQIMAGTGAGQISTITANTATALTVSPAWTTTPDATSVYSIGFINSYWKTKWFDFNMPEMRKKYKWLNIFCDTANWLMNVGIATGFQKFAFSQALPLSSGALSWEGPSGPDTWGEAGKSWGAASSEFGRLIIGAQDRFIQAGWGTVKSGQPWRVFRYSMTYKEKKESPDIISTPGSA